MSHRALWRVLVASLCFNALLAGYVGVLWLRPPKLLSQAVSPELFIVRTAERLPESDADALLSAFAKYEAEIAKDRPEFAAAYKQLAAALKEDEIDEEEIRRLTGVLVALNSRTIRLITNVFVDATPAFSPATRQRMARRFEQ